jgi:hypothetical protein
MRHIISFEHNKKHLISFNGERPALKIQGKVQTHSNQWDHYENQLTVLYYEFVEWA